MSNASKAIKDDYWNLYNLLNVHENAHYFQWLANGGKASRVSKEQQYKGEIDAISAQKRDPSWEKTTDDFKQETERYKDINVEKLRICFEMVNENKYSLFFDRISTSLTEQWGSIVNEKKLELCEKEA